VAPSHGRRVVHYRRAPRRIAAGPLLATRGPGAVQKMLARFPSRLLGVRCIVVGSHRPQKSKRHRFHHKREEAYRKQEKFWSRIEQDDKWKATISKFDKDKSGNLDAEELTKIIKEFGAGYWDNEGKHHPPSPKEKEVAWIMQATQHDSLGMEIGKVKFALDLWHAYENVRADLDDCFEKFDKDKSGLLDKNELCKLLTSLNDGHTPSVMDFYDQNEFLYQEVLNIISILYLSKSGIQDEEVDLLLSLEHDATDKSWLRLAVALWSGLPPAPPLRTSHCSGMRLRIIHAGPNPK
jgi:hypothetical protein